MLSRQEKIKILKQFADGTFSLEKVEALLSGVETVCLAFYEDETKRQLVYVGDDYLYSQQEFDRLSALIDDCKFSIIVIGCWESYKHWGCLPDMKFYSGRRK